LKRGFSLLELLVVIAIVGVLASLLVPAIGGAHNASQSAVCQSNQRHLVTATSLYRADHEANPPAVTYRQQDEITLIIAWDDETVLWQYVDAEQDAMVCPKHIITTGSATGFNYNTSFIGDEDYLFTEMVRGVAPSSCAHPASCALFGDCSANKFMRSPLLDETYDPYTDPYTRCAGRQAFRHQGATNVAWLDGHVGPVTKKFAGCDDESDSGFLSSDNSAYDPRTLQLP
jgi:prepilin-type N-terminal cleavage/methylation domain-containing protein/prepilin-type processing-associated H-X9-DG protein